MCIDSTTSSTRRPHLRTWVRRKSDRLLHPVAAVLESLERRVLFNALLVNTLADENVPGEGLMSLREAIQYANANSGTDNIYFAPGLTGTIRAT